MSGDEGGDGKKSVHEALLLRYGILLLPNWRVLLVWLLSKKGPRRTFWPLLGPLSALSVVAGRAQLTCDAGGLFSLSPWPFRPPLGCPFPSFFLRPSLSLPVTSSLFPFTSSRQCPIVHGPWFFMGYTHVIWFWPTWLVLLWPSYTWYFWSLPCGISMFGLCFMEFQILIHVIQISSYYKKICRFFVPHPPTDQTAYRSNLKFWLQCVFRKRFVLSEAIFYIRPRGWDMVCFLTFFTPRRLHEKCQEMSSITAPRPNFENRFGQYKSFA